MPFNTVFLRPLNWPRPKPYHLSTMTAVNANHKILSDLFSRRFREGVSFPNFAERSILKLPLSKLCAVPLALQNRAFFGREQRCQEKRKRGGQERGQKGKRTREERSAINSRASGIRKGKPAADLELTLPRTLPQPSDRTALGTLRFRTLNPALFFLSRDSCSDSIVSAPKRKI